MMTTEASYRWRLERLHIEHGVYFPLSAGPNKGDVGGHESQSTGEIEGAIGAETKDSYYKDAFLKYRVKSMLWRKDNDQQDDGDIDDAHTYTTSPRSGDATRGATRKSSGKDDSFHINVSVRFKPLDHLLAGNNGSVKSATLPLHQRLALIRFENKLSSNAEALNILKQEGAWFKDKWSVIEQEEHQEEDQHLSSTKLTVQNDDDQNDASQPSLVCGVNHIDCESNKVVIVDPTKGLRNFQFDNVISDSSTQAAVYEESARPLITDFINGVNASCLVYGVTGSGKTYTMFGPEDRNLYCTEEVQSHNGMSGIVPRACKEIFDALSYRREHLNLKMDANVAVSYIEIYGSHISDLLQRGSSCCPNKAASQRFVLSGAAELPVHTVSDVLTSLRLGDKQKRKAATAMNERSSRAHSIFIVTLRQKCEQTGVSRTSKLFLVDLGGCEQTKKSNVESGSSKHFEHMKREIMMSEDDSTGQDVENDGIVTGSDSGQLHSTGFVKSDRMREAVYINLGLMALKNCVNALVSGERTKYIPYADSKLTMMLSTALGGNSKTSVIVCAAQDQCLVTETIAALKFGQSCRRVKNAVQSETDFLKELIQQLDSQIAQCEDEIRAKERWEVREEKRIDELAEEGTLEQSGFGGVEVRKTTVLVGAEEEHARLAELLKKKATITGTSVESNVGGKKYGGSLGFGVAYKYGLGEKHSMQSKNSKSYRFGEVKEDDIPELVKMAGGKGGWKNKQAGEDDNKMSQSDLSKLEARKKRSTLVYSGLS